ncbi:hypothetical protein Plec18167_006158 [Paecilomyces lecythidis]|uniref:Uncharacterized protein n=1 Tax=Paecilomyces lecythidis TaxID=3004212 RepID=A0ABR3XD15_9EURO
MLSIGTGTTVKSPATASPHFRHVFRDGFLSRAFHAWMSSMDTERKWKEMKAQLDESIAEDFFRFNVTLEDKRMTLDDIQAMDDYRNLVALQPGSSRAAREVALALLTARFFFTLDAAPETGSRPFWCYGTIRCKAPASVVLPAIQRLVCEKIDVMTDSASLGPFLGDRGICPTCGRFCQPISLRVRHPDDVISIYLKTGRPSRRSWRINSFPSTVSTLASRQGLGIAFGRPDHGHLGAEPCHTCDERNIWNRRRRRRRPSHVSSDEQSGAKRRRHTGET